MSPTNLDLPPDLPSEDDLLIARSPPRIRRIPVSDQIHAALRDRIVSMALEPGRNLSRQEIAAYYGVSQTPVRDAMLKLEEEGLLLVFPQSKTEVSKIDVSQARETQFLRLSVELEVARTLTGRPNKAALGDARKIVELQQAALGADGLERFFRLDRLFHQALCEAAGVSNLWALITARSGHIDRLRNLNLPDPGKPANIVDYHGRILAAIEASDFATAEAAVRGHLTGTLSQVHEIRKRYPQFFTSPPGST